MEHTIDWGSAEVGGGELRVRLDHDADFAFLEAFDMVLIESRPAAAASWGDVQFASGRIVVRNVQKGSGAPLREFLERVVREANARGGPERDRMARGARREQESAEQKRRATEAADDAAERRDDELENEFRQRI
jgi:hypothetical protein